MASSEHLLIDDREHRRTITLNRPEKRNALTPSLLESLVEACREGDQDRDTRVLILRGAGEKAFSAGFDISRIESPGGTEPGAERDIVEQAYTRLRALRTPLVAMVNGHAVGAGCDLVATCDLRVAARGAKFAIPTSKIGLLYSWQGMRRFLDLIGVANAKEMFLTGDPIPAQRAHEMGLVNRVVAPEELEETTHEFVRGIVEGAPLSVQASKAILDRLLRLDSPDEETRRFIEQEQERVWESEDAREGTQAFLDKRDPEFKGR